MRFKVPNKQPANFRASALYLSGHAKGQSPDRVAWVKSYNLSTDEPTPAAAVMQATADQNRRCKSAAYHFIISFDPKDAKGGKVTPEKMQEMADEVVERFGLKEYQALVYAHKDTDHPHMHFLVNRIHPEKLKALSRHNDGRRLKDLSQEIAKERGLNIAKDKDRGIDREVDDFEGMANTPSANNPKEGEHWQAKREGREAQNLLSKEAIKSLRDEARQHFLNAPNWRDLTTRLAARGVSLERKGQGLILMTDNGYAKLSQMGKSVRLKDIEERFGEGFDDWMKRFGPEMAKLAEEENLPEGYKDMSPALRRKAERLHTSKKDVERKRGDKVAELDAADREYRYVRGVRAFMSHKAKGLSRAEREKERKQKLTKAQKRTEKRAAKSYHDGMGGLFDDGKKATEKWDDLEAKYGAEKAMKMIKKNPDVLGKIAWNKGADKAKEIERRSKKIMGQLARSRKMWQERQFKLVFARQRRDRAEIGLRRAREGFGQIKSRFWSRYTQQEYLVTVMQRRMKALDRVRADEIRMSTLAEKRKEELIFQHKRHEKEKKRLEKQRKKQRERDRGL